MSRAKGAIGEMAARRYLTNEGFAILEANYTLRSGEIDIIAREKDTIVFIEVKSATRESAFGDPINWIPQWKQQRIIRASLMYLKAKGMTEAPMRYDVITVGQDKQVFHVRDAFRVASPFSL